MFCNFQPLSVRIICYAEMGKKYISILEDSLHSNVLIAIM